MRAKRHFRKSRFTLNHLLVVFLAVLIGTQVIISNRIATSGKELAHLESQQLSLIEENQKILSENVDMMSLHQLAQHAKALGYIEPATVLHLAPDQELVAFGE